MKHISWFTLVELIVVITVLAILGTVSFISLVRNNADARDAIRISDTKVLARTIGIHVNAEHIGNIQDFIETPLLPNTISTGSVFSWEILSNYSYSVGTPNPVKFGVHNFNDPTTHSKYPISIIRWNYGTFYQVGATLEDKNAIIHGNYYTIWSNDLKGLIKSYNGTWIVINWGIDLPY